MGTGRVRQAPTDCPPSTRPGFLHRFPNPKRGSSRFHECSCCLPATLTLRPSNPTVSFKAVPSLAGRRRRGPGHRGAAGCTPPRPPGRSCAGGLRWSRTASERAGARCCGCDAHACRSIMVNCGGVAVWHCSIVVVVVVDGAYALHTPEKGWRLAGPPGGVPPTGVPPA